MPKSTFRAKFRGRSVWSRLLRWGLLLLIAWYGTVLAGLLALKILDPQFTAVHAQRRVESWFGKRKYQKHYRFVAMARISRDLQHAVVAAEDTRFFEHRGFDWVEIKDAVYDDLEDGRIRGASTITQQLVKNLFLTTGGSVFRKAAEFAIVPAAELILGKQRILELYLNVIEWGPGVYGAEAASQYHYGEPAARVGREQAARLAAILPSPRRRKPARMDQYCAVILERMRRMGW